MHERHNFENLIGAKAEFKIEQRKYAAMSEHPRLLASQNYTLQDIKDHEARLQAWHRAWDGIKTRASGDEHISDIILKPYQPRSGSVDLDEDADARHANNLLMREAEMAAAERARQARRERTGELHAEDLAGEESAAQRKAREMASSIAGGAVSFARDPANAMGDAVSDSVSFLAGRLSSDAVSVGETVVGGVGSAAAAIAKVATPVQKPRKRQRPSAQRKERIKQKVEQFPANPMVHPCAGFHQDLQK